MNPYRKIYIRINTNCNQNCLNCVIEDFYKKQQYELDPKKLDNILQIIEIDDKSDIFIITGGEPTIHPNFNKIISIIRNYFSGELILLTNGYLIGTTSKLDELLKMISSSTLTIYSKDETINDKITGVKESLTAKLNTLKKFKENNIIIYAKTIITQFSYNKLTEIVDFIIAKNDNIKIISLNMLHLISNAWENRNSIAIKCDLVVPFLEKALDRFEEYGISGSIVFPMCLIDPYYWKYFPVGFGDIVSKSLAIEPNGKLLSVARKLTRFISKPQKCIQCPIKNRCYWPHDGYIKYFGDNELKAIESF